MIGLSVALIFQCLATLIMQFGWRRDVRRLRLIEDKYSATLLELHAAHEKQSSLSDALADERRRHAMTIRQHAGL